MPAWTSDELTKIGSAYEMHIASVRRDGSLRKPVIVWIVRQGNDLYTRSVNGQTPPRSVAPRYATKAASRPAA